MGLPWEGSMGGRGWSVGQVVTQHNSPLLPERHTLFYTVQLQLGDRGAIGNNSGDFLEIEHKGRSVDVCMCVSVCI